MWTKKLVLGLLALALLVPTVHAQGVSITPVSSFSNTQESTTATTLQNSDVVITAANLQSGVDYLVFYTVSYGSNGTSNVPEVAVTYGATTIAYGADEGSSSGSPEAMRIGSLHGYYILTGDGVSDLRLQFSANTGGTCWIMGKSLVAIPLTAVTVYEDYWFVQQNGDAAEVSTTAAFVDLLADSDPATFTDNFNSTGTFSWTPDLTQAGVYNVTFFSSAINRSPGLFRTADSKTSNGTENTGRPAVNQSLGANDGTARIT